ncbi:MAG: PaaI family thioesterase [Caulobacteraceae bacterium]
MASDDSLLEEMGAAMAQGTPQSAALGMQLVSVTPGSGVMKVPYREDLVGDPATGVLAGGVITSLLDHVCGLSVGSLHRGGTATLDLRIDYMRPAQPRRDVLAAAHCYKLTHSIGFVRASAYESDPADPIATAQAAFVLNPPTSNAP